MAQNNNAAPGWSPGSDENTTACKTDSNRSRSSLTTADAGTGQETCVQKFARENGLKPCEAIARIAGFGSCEQCRQARFVTEHGSNELVAAMDSGKIAIHNAAFIARWSEDIQREIVSMERKKIILLVKILKHEMRNQDQEGEQ